MLIPFAKEVLCFIYISGLTVACLMLKYHKPVHMFIFFLFNMNAAYGSCHIDLVVYQTFRSWWVRACTMVVNYTRYCYNWQRGKSLILSSCIFHAYTRDKIFLLRPLSLSHSPFLFLVLMICITPRRGSERKYRGEC